MSQTLTIPNFSQSNILEVSTLQADASSGQATVTVENNHNFGVNSIAVIGQIGSETLEKIQVQSVSNTVLTATANLSRTHNKFSNITKLYGNKIKIYRADNVDGTQPEDASFTLLGTAIDIDFDDIQTRFEDTDGTSDHWYKSTYYNSISDSETPLSDSTAKRGGGYGNYATIESIRNMAGFKNNRYISDPLIDEKRQAAQSLINAELKGIYTIPFTAPINTLIAEITRKLAAGYLLAQESTNAAMRAQGEKLIAEVTNKDKNGTLDRLNKKELQLVGILGDSEATTGSTNFSGWPDSTTSTASASNGGNPRLVRSSDRY